MKNVLLLCLCIFGAMVESGAQTKAFQLNLEKNEELRNTVFDAENGTWLITAKLESMLKGTVEYKVMKYSPGADTPTWESKALVGYGTSAPMYAPDNPNYLYFFDEGKRGAKLRILQVSPDGVSKARECVYKGEDVYMGFADAQSFYLLTEAEEDEFKLRKYEHATWKSSVHKLKLPEDEGEHKFRDWTLAGITDAQFSLIRYGKKKSQGVYQVASFDLGSGKLLDKMTYKYDEEKYPLVVGTTNRRFRDGATVTDGGDALPNFGDDYVVMVGQKHNSYVYTEDAVGNLIPALDDEGYYFLSSVTKKRFGISSDHNISGFVLQKLDNSGKVLWSEEVPFIKEELGLVIASRMGTSTIALRQYHYGEEDLVVEYSYVSDTKLWRESDMKTLHVAFDLATGKWRKTEITDSAADLENQVLPFLPTKTNNLKEYFKKNGIVGKCKVYSSGQSALLTVAPKGDKQVVGVIYFE